MKRLNFKPSSWWTIGLVVIALAFMPIAGLAANSAAKVVPEAVVNTGPPGANNAANPNPVNANALNLDVGNPSTITAINVNLGPTVAVNVDNNAASANNFANTGTSAVVANPNAGNNTQNALANTFISPENIGVNVTNAADNAANPNASPAAIDTGQANGAVTQVNNAGNPVARNVTHQAKKI